MKLLIKVEDGFAEPPYLPPRSSAAGTFPPAFGRRDKKETDLRLAHKGPVCQPSRKSWILLAPSFSWKRIAAFLSGGLGSFGGR